VGTAALAGRLARRHNGHADEPLAFHHTGGPLVAVCGLVGGAGTSTLAFLLAREAARRSSVPVLLAELHDHGALATLAGGGGGHGLAGLAGAVDNEQLIAAPFTELAGGPRLVAASRPTLDPAPPMTPAALERVVGDARAVHGLVVVDTGRVSDPGAAALRAAASHVLFVVSATTLALALAEALGAAGVFTQAGGAHPSLVAVGRHPGRSPSLRQLRRLAERHADRLLLVPHLDSLAASDPARAERQLEPTYAALASLLRSTR
jgi:hypothetical protein